MFGKGKTQKSENDKFVMAMGRKAANLKAPRTHKKPMPKKGKEVHK